VLIFELVATRLLQDKLFRIKVLSSTAFILSCLCDVRICTLLEQAMAAGSPATRSAPECTPSGHAPAEDARRPSSPHLPESLQMQTRRTGSMDALGDAR
ncbi:Putative Zn-dependent peptidase, partial [Giardia duodenalis]